MKKYISLSVLLFFLSACGESTPVATVEVEEKEVLQIEPITEREKPTPVIEKKVVAEKEVEVDAQKEVVDAKPVVTPEPKEEKVVPVKNAAKTYSLMEVAEHNTQEDCWTVIDGQVADVTSFFGEHPGGDRDLAKACGIDASVIFAREREHNPDGYEMLKKFIIGTLK